jgi:hypothetical protein
MPLRALAASFQTPEEDAFSRETGKPSPAAEQHVVSGETVVMKRSKENQGIPTGSGAFQ